MVNYILYKLSLPALIQFILRYRNPVAKIKNSAFIFIRNSLVMLHAPLVYRVINYTQWNMKVKYFCSRISRQLASIWSN